MSGLSLRRFLLAPAQVLQRSSKIPIIYSRALSEVTDKKELKVFTSPLAYLKDYFSPNKPQEDGKLVWEYNQVLSGNNDPWCLEELKYPRSNHTKPHIVYTMESNATVACNQCMDGQHYENYMIIEVNHMGRCKDCGNCFVLLPHPEPELIYQDHH